MNRTLIQAHGSLILILFMVFDLFLLIRLLEGFITRRYKLYRKERVVMEDKGVGILISAISLSIFSYYTFWVIILVSFVGCLLLLISCCFKVYGLKFMIWISGDFLLVTFLVGSFQPFVDEDHFIHKYFLPQEFAILIPVLGGVALLSFLCLFIGFVILKLKYETS